MNNILRVIMFALSGLMGLIICKFLDNEKDKTSYDVTTLERREGNNDSNK